MLADLKLVKDGETSLVAGNPPKRKLALFSAPTEEDVSIPSTAMEKSEKIRSDR